MTATLTLDKAGRLIIPKKVRDEMHMGAGDVFQMENTGDELVLRPVRQELTLRKKHGIWVAYGGEPISAAETDAILQSVRNERDAQNHGLK